MSKQKTTITLPNSLYHALRNQAKKQNLSLPEFIEKHIKLAPADPTLSKLSLGQILKSTTPQNTHPDSRIDFFQ